MIKKCQSNQDFEHAKRIVADYVQWLNIDLSFQDYETELKHFRRIYAPPFGAFFIALNDANVVGGIGLRQFKDRIGEVKRLYVSDSNQNQGLGKALVEAVIHHAHAIGYHQLVLDTLPSMTAAQRLYLKRGFSEISPYRENPIAGTKFMALLL